MISLDEEKLRRETAKMVAIVSVYYSNIPKTLNMTPSELIDLTNDKLSNDLNLKRVVGDFTERFMDILKVEDLKSRGMLS